MRRETFFKQIAIDRLGGGGPLAGGDDHLAIGRRYTARGVETPHASPHALIDFDLPVGIELRAEFLRELVMEDVAAGRENVVDLDGGIARVLELEGHEVTAAASIAD